jgi:hypothetical protein
MGSFAGIHSNVPLGQACQINVPPGSLNDGAPAESSTQVPDPVLATSDTGGGWIIQAQSGGESLIYVCESS